MTGAVAQTKFRDLYEKADRLLRRGGFQIDIARLASEAKDLRNADPVEAREISAMVSLIKRDMPAAVAEYERAIEASGRRFDVLVRGMMVLGLVGQSSSVADFYRRYVCIEELDPDSREYVASALGFSGWAAESTMIRLAMKEAGMALTSSAEIEGLVLPPKSSHHDSEAAPGVSASLSSLHMSRGALEATGISEEWIAERVGASLRFLLDRHTDVIAVRPSPVPQEGGRQGIIVNFFVDVDAESGSAIEWDLFGHLTSEFPDVLDNEDVSFALVATGGVNAG
ncbi:hypothetical protein JY407_05080 [Stenotrophomonas maltophilia]|uniref:hypothetical protein n=1 Tax=Stenotrophomonas maltophilia TaxID=40324 RepID=UPI00074A67FE|nr:hypothetical protein [Stenotrophomonas maltophilia]KUJ02445.1 hypothetical protein AR275_19115 [Stenotrophomonas maltophilia]MBN4990744.1 hypothetical protein [Stenotrophomonas maltophilia]